MPRLRSPLLLAWLCSWLLVGSAGAIVNYEKGRRIVRGVQLLQDASDPTAFFYLPQFPRLATREDGSLELLCLKYVDVDGGASGGLLHALVEFTLPAQFVAEIEEELAKQLPGARIAGPVPLMQAVEDGESGMGSFQVVSSILGDTAEGGLTRSVITSGRAPLAPGSKAVVAAMLEPKGATLLWESLSGPTSDVSVSIQAYYEAAVEAYGAQVTAEVATVYEHFSRIANVQKDFTRRQLRDVVDELQRDGTLEVKVLDRSESLGVDSKEMEGILSLVTDKLTELMFDAEAGWAKEPTREAAVESGQIPGRQQRSWLQRTFGGTHDTKYYTDNQYVLKKREDIQRNTFRLNLSKATSIKVPVDAAGNLGGIFDAVGEDERYFRVVRLDDPTFEMRRVHFQIDGNSLDAFRDTVNFVSVNFRKVYGDDQPAFTRTLTFSHADVQEGKTIQEIAFPRLGALDPGWTRYEYQVRWSLREGPTLSDPPQSTRWLSSSDAAVALVPPFARRDVELEADRELFGERQIATAVVEFATILGDEPKVRRRVTLRADDADAVTRLSLYHDRGEPVAYRVSWYSPGAQVRGELEPLESDFLFLVPPAPPAGGDR